MIDKIKVALSHEQKEKIANLIINFLEKKSGESARQEICAYLRSKGYYKQGLKTMIYMQLAGTIGARRAKSKTRTATIIYLK